MASVNEFINNLSLHNEKLFFLNTYGSLYSVNTKKMKVEELHFYYQMGKYLIKLESINLPFQEFFLNNLGKKY